MKEAQREGEREGEGFAKRICKYVRIFNGPPLGNLCVVLERERARQRKRAEKRINKIREFTNQFNVLNSTQPKVNLNLNLNDKFSTAKKKLENEINEIIIIFRPTLGDASPAAL